MSDEEDSHTETEEEEEEDEESVDSSPTKPAEAGEEPTETPAKKTPAKKPPAKSPASTPKRSYLKLAQDAIIAMKDRTGSSMIAIQKWILANHPDMDPKRLKIHLNRTLKAGVAKNQLVKVKASYKLHPNAKKKPKAKAAKKKAKAKAKAKPVKKLTPAQLAAQKERERKAAKEKERQDKIRKRKFPMEDLALIAEDKQLQVKVDLPSRPSLELVFPSMPAACKSDSMGSGIMEDIFHIYHFFRGDVGWGRLTKIKRIVAPFSLSQWMECVKQVMDGVAKKTRMVPPLMSHLFVVSLQHLVPSKLQVGLTPASWSEILLLYMDATERYYTTEASEGANVLPGLPIDTEYLLQATDEEKERNQLEPVVPTEEYFYLRGGLHKAHAKLFTQDPWMLGAEDLLALLRALVDDLLATLPECAVDIDLKLFEIHEAQKYKRAADAHLRRLTTTKNKELAEEKEREAKEEKATRSNTKLPTVSEAQIESARRAVQKANGAFEKARRGGIARTQKIGEDRHFNQFHHFQNDPERVYVLQKGKQIPSQVSYTVPTSAHFRANWYSIDKKSTLESFLESLDVRGNRESALREALDGARRTVYDDIKVLNDQKALLRDKRELQRKLENAKMKCEVGRKSGRLAAQSEQELESLQAEIDNLEGAIAGAAAPVPKPDMEVETGLVMLRDFDRQDSPDQRRRKTRRDVRKEQAGKEDEESLPRLQCSRLWPSGNIDGTGIVGSIVWELLALEERVEKLATWEGGDRKGWISSLEDAAFSWDTQTITATEEVADSKEDLDESPKSKNEGGSTDSSSQTVSQLVHVIKQPLLQLEKRIFEMSGLAMAARDSDEADDNMSTNPEEVEREKLEQSWKRIINRLKYFPAKAHSKIRQAVVEGISAARKAHLPAIVAQLREALLQFHPEAANACKKAALIVLTANGDYDDADDDDEDELEMEEEEEPKEDNSPQTEGGISSSLCAEAVILNSSLDGQEDASRVDWIAAVKKAKTIAKMASLVAAFCAKASEKLDKIESETDALNEALREWQKASQRKKPSETIEPSEVWANVNFTDDFCLARVQEYPWWPAKKCVAKDKNLAEKLTGLDRTLVSLIGESGGLRVVKSDDLAPFSESPIDEKSLTNQSKDIRAQFDECMTMARRIIRGKQKKASRSSRKKQKVSTDNEFKEEKKLAS